MTDFLAEAIQLFFHAPYVAIGILVFAFLYSYVLRIVQSGTAVLVERFGCYVRTLTPGLHVMLPLVESARGHNWFCQVDTAQGGIAMLRNSGDYVDMREIQLDVPAFTVFTVDRLEAKINCVLYFRIVDAQAAVYNTENLYGGISSIVETTLRSSTCTLTLDEAIAGIVPIRRAVTEALAAKQEHWGIKLTNFDIQSVEPPRQIIEATTHAVIAARDAEQRKRVAEAEQQLRMLQVATALTTARGEAERKTLAAQTDAECARLASEAEAARVRMRGEADAASLRARGEARAAGLQAMRATGVSGETIAALDAAKGWRAVAKRTNTTLVVPFESARYLGNVALLDADAAAAPVRASPRIKGG